MARISVGDVSAWVDGSKLTIDQLDSDLEEQMAAEVFSQISAAYPSATTSTWTNETNTPALVRKIISMLYVGWYYQRVYSEDADTSNYGMLLIAQAERLIAGLNDGALILEGVVGLTPIGNPTFYPTDASSAQDATVTDMSLGGPRFSMGTIW
jgi:hypothetical protein